MNWPHSATAIRIATPAKTVVAASGECVSIASRIPSNSSETPCALARRRSIREARIRDPDEHNQHEDDERDCVEEVEALERQEVMMGGRDDEARNRRAEAETEVACDSSERGRCGALLRRDQGQGQDLAGRSHESEAGTADGRADEALPRTVDKRQAPVAECVHDIARDQDPFRTETIEERTRRERYHCGRAHDRRQYQPRRRGREAADRVEVDDLEGKDQSGAEVVERVPALKNEDRPR